MTDAGRAPFTPEDARALATRAHEGQVDKTGRAYIRHVEEVADGVANEADWIRIAAWLHDVVEDTDTTLDDLRSLGVPEESVFAVDALTKREGERLEAYVARLVATPGAVAVKRSDLASNTRPERVAQLDGQTRERLAAKYRHVSELIDSLETAVDLVRRAERVTVLTGAGISTDSGISDYRGPAGLWRSRPDYQELVDFDRYISDADVRRRSWQMRLEVRAWDKEPNAGHLAIAEFEHTGRLRGLITQNVDGLHGKAGSSDVLEVHGAVAAVVCLDCGDRTTIEQAEERILGGEPDPACRVCGGILKVETVMFGQALDPRVISRAADAVAECDVLVAVGSTLGVYPVAGLPALARDAGAALVIVNDGETAYDGSADAVVRGPISATLPVVLGHVPGR